MGREECTPSCNESSVAFFRIHKLSFRLVSKPDRTHLRSGSVRMQVIFPLRKKLIPPALVLMYRVAGTRLPTISMVFKGFGYYDSRREPYPFD